MTRQDIAAAPPNRGSGFRLVFAVAFVLAAVLYAEYRTYGLPAPSEASEPGGPRAVPATFQARLPPEPGARPADASAADPPAPDAEFRDAPAVIEPAVIDPERPVAGDAFVPPSPVDPPPADPIGERQLAALTPGMLPSGLPDAAIRPAPRAEPGPALWRVNAVPFERRPAQPLIAVIIDDAGLDRARTARATRLPAPLTISFLPYAGDVARQADEARRRGHELMLHLPMEPLGPHENPGPDALTTRQSGPELLRRLDLHLGRFDGYVGVNNHMGSRFTQEREAMLPVLEAVRARGLLFVDSRTVGATVAGALADRLGLPGTARDVFIDHDGSAAAVRARLDDIERIARRTGKAVAIGHPHDVTLDALERWLPGLAERGFALAPVSAVVLRRLEAAR
ncbi:MAG: divergent polysaccharide deacetylase family protein [Alphaproteobacteria bacterium]|nr:divergent polysaccharide deacetylase family protein [Alphaproteobacteria bacterium]